MKSLSISRSVAHSAPAQPWEEGKILCGTNLWQLCWKWFCACEIARSSALWSRLHALTISQNFCVGHSCLYGASRVLSRRSTCLTHMLDRSSSNTCARKHRKCCSSSSLSTASPSTSAHPDRVSLACSSKCMSLICKDTLASRNSPSPHSCPA